MSHNPSPNADRWGGPGAGDLGAEDLEDGENTYEGDVGNDVTPEGGIDPNRRGRTH